MATMAIEANGNGRAPGDRGRLRKRATIAGKPVDKGGRPKVIDKSMEREILAILTTGGSMKDAAKYVGIGYATLWRRRETDRGFENRLNKAVLKGKLNHIRKIGRAKQWQASAFMLERKWWKEYAKRDKQEHGGTVRHKVTHDFDFDRFAEEIDAVRREREAVAGRVLPANGN